MNWKTSDPLTTDQLSYIRNFGGRISVTSARTGTVLDFSLVKTKMGNGLAVNLLGKPDNQYIGYIPVQNGVPSSKFVHTKGSSVEPTHKVFVTFAWLWKNWGNHEGVTIKGC